MKRIITIALLSITVASFAQTSNEKPASAAAKPAASATKPAASTTAQPTPRPAAKPQPAAQKAPVTPEQEAKYETERMNKLMPLGASAEKVMAANTNYFAQKAQIYNDQNRGVQLTPEQRIKLRDLNEVHAKDLQAAMGKENYDKLIAAEREKAKVDSEKAKERKEQKAATPATK